MILEDRLKSLQSLSRQEGGNGTTISVQYAAEALQQYQDLLFAATAAHSNTVQELKEVKRRLDRWEGRGGFVEAIRDSLGADSTWPDHGNAPLAIASVLALTHLDLEQARQEITDLQEKLNKAIDDLNTHKRALEATAKTSVLITDQRDRARTQLEQTRVSLTAIEQALYQILEKTSQV